MLFYKLQFLVYCILYIDGFYKGADSRRIRHVERFKFYTPHCRAEHLANTEYAGQLSWRSENLNRKNESVYNINKIHLKFVVRKISFTEIKCRKYSGDVCSHHLSAKKRTSLIWQEKAWKVIGTVTHAKNMYMYMYTVPTRVNTGTGKLNVHVHVHVLKRCINLEQLQISEHHFSPKTFCGSGWSDITAFAKGPCKVAKFSGLSNALQRGRLK